MRDLDLIPDTKLLYVYQNMARISEWARGINAQIGDIGDGIPGPEGPPGGDSLGIDNVVMELYGANPGIGQTSVNMLSDGGLLIAGQPGVPVALRMTAVDVTVTFMADNVPAGPGIATLWRRSHNGDFNTAAQFTFQTS
jgi:hypothetical protein